MTLAGLSAPMKTSLSAIQFFIRGIIIIHYQFEERHPAISKKTKKNKCETNPIVFFLFQRECKRTGSECSHEFTAQFRPIIGQVYGLAIGYGISTGVARARARQLRPWRQNISRTRPDSAQGRNSSVK